MTSLQFIIILFLCIINSITFVIIKRQKDILFKNQTRKKVTKNSHFGL